MKEKLIDIFQDLFPAIENPEQVSAENTPQWDSLAHLNLILSIEEEFHIDIDTSEIPRLHKDFNTILGYINQHSRSLV